jgi:predicted GNAT superfamily acetyltransferase
VTAPLRPANQLLLYVPSDIIGMRAESPQKARRWREALRETMVTALDAGYACEGMTRDGDYVLRATPPA